MLLVISYCVTNLIIFMHIKFKLLEYSRNLHEVLRLTISFVRCPCSPLTLRHHNHILL